MDTSSGSTGTSIGSEEDQRKRKRMLSNRESARRSRVRKQKQLDDLMGQVGELRKEGAQIVNALNVTTHRYLGAEAENSVLRTQMMELSSRLQSLNEILLYMHNQNNDSPQLADSYDGFIGSWDSMVLNQQSIMVPVDMIDHYY